MQWSALVSFEFPLRKRCGNWKDFKGEQMRRGFLSSENEKRLNNPGPLKRTRKDRLSVFKYVQDYSEVKGSSQSVLHVPAVLMRSNELKLQDRT